MANAALDSIPMVVIAGDVPSHYYGKHPHQEVNLHADASQYEIYRPFVKRAWRVDSPHLFPEIIEKAFALAESGRPGPGAGRRADGHLLEGDRRRAVRARCGRTPRRCTSRRSTRRPPTRSSASCSQAKTPLLYVGGGILLADAADELREFVEHLQIPVAHTLMGKGALPDDHPLILGMTGFWGTKFINDKCRGADWILGLGTRFSEADCSSWEPEYTFNFPPTKLIHIDIDPAEIGRNYPVEIGAVADLKQALTVLNRVARKLAPERRRSGRSSRARSRRTATAFVAGNRKAHARATPSRCGRSGSSPTCAQALPRDALITHRRGLEQERRRPAVPDLHAGHDLHAGRLRDDGLRRAGRARRQDRAARTASSSRWSATAASARTRRCSPPRSRRTSRWSG